MASSRSVDASLQQAAKDAGYIRMANELLSQLQIPTRVASLEEVGANCFVPLYEGLCGEQLPDIIRSPRSIADDRHNLQTIIDSLSTDVLHVSLSHIRAEDILRGEKTAICNLLEIFQSLMEYLLNRIEPPVGAGGDADEEQLTEGEVADLEEEYEDFPDEFLLASRGSGGLSPPETKQQEGRGSPLVPSPPPYPRTSTESPAVYRPRGILRPESLGVNRVARRARSDSHLSPERETVPKEIVGLRLSRELHPPQRVSLQSAVDSDQDSSAGGAHARSDAEYLRLREHVDRVSHEARKSWDDFSSMKKMESVGNLAQELAARHRSAAPPVPDSAPAPGAPQEDLSPARSADERVAREMQLRRKLRQLLGEAEQDPDDTTGTFDVSSVTETDKNRWYDDYIRFRDQQEEEEVVSARLHDYAREHEDLVESVRHPPGRARRRQQFQDRTNQQPAQVSTEEWMATRGDLVRQIYEQQLDQVAQDELHTLDNHRKTVTRKENASRKLMKSVSTGSRLQRRLAVAPSAPGPGRIRSGVRQRSPRRRTQSARSPPQRRDTEPGEPQDELLAALLDKFPYLELAPQTLNQLRQEAEHRSDSLLKGLATEARRRQRTVSGGGTRAEKQVQEAERRQALLAHLLRKEMEHTARVRDMKERRAQEQAVRAQERERKMASVRSKQYYDEFAVRQRAKMLQKRSREEVIFRRLFKEALELQKERLRELRRYAKEYRERRSTRQLDSLDSLEQYYRDRFELLANELRKERETLESREQAQDQLASSLRGELRRKMEAEVRGLQEQMVRDEDEAFYRQLDADRALVDLYRTKDMPQLSQKV